MRLNLITSRQRNVGYFKDEEAWEDTLIGEHNRGRQQEKMAIARSLIREGISTEVITRTTGLTAAKIEKLRQS